MPLVPSSTLPRLGVEAVPSSLIPPGVQLQPGGVGKLVLPLYLGPFPPLFVHPFTGVASTAFWPSASKSPLVRIFCASAGLASSAATTATTRGAHRDSALKAICHLLQKADRK